MNDNVKQILAIMERVKENQFTNFNIATHVIFNDNNIGQGHLQSALQDAEGWKSAINDKLDNVWMPETLREDLKDIAETITALLELSAFADEDLELAQEILNPE